MIFRGVFQTPRNVSQAEHAHSPRHYNAVAQEEREQGIETDVPLEEHAALEMPSPLLALLRLPLESSDGLVCLQSLIQHSTAPLTPGLGVVVVRAIPGEKELTPQRPTVADLFLDDRVSRRRIHHV